MELFDTHPAPSERRAFQRKECNIPLPGIGTVHNVGLGGICLEADRLSDERRINLAFNLNFDRPVIADAKVVNKRSLKKRTVYGLQFVDIDVHSRLNILEYLREKALLSPVAEDVRLALENFISTWPHQYNLVSPEFKKEIADFRLYLNQLKGILQREEKKLAALPPDLRAQTIESIIDFYEAKLQDRVHKMILAVDEVIRDFTETEHAMHRAYFQEQLLDFTNDSVFFNRALNKPLGYAGDYVMMEMLYHGLRDGETLWQKVINSCLTSLPMGQAVRHRAWYLSERILQCLDSRNYPSIYPRINNRTYGL